ncbi:MAG TPA: peptidyl-prolyl cis-trans isomerase [Steroidobacteraceae bacterium]|jgi:peptidyl-prolyl cis-trans isomerase D|nr:peptidyl-prolyl cis-trans isomerase [Steroidobacteraceae bacterium]
MLQNLGDKLKGQRWLATLVLGLLALLFAIWGAYGVVNLSFGQPDYGLKIDGERISTETLNRAWQERQAQYARMLNGSEMGDAQKLVLQQQLLDQYIRSTLLRQRAEKDGYRATPDALRQSITSEPAFQVDGKFDPRAARTALAQAGLSETAYYQERAQQLAVEQLDQAIESSDFTTPAEMQHIYALANEQREIRYALLPPDHFQNAVKIDDAKVKAWYDAHQSDYMTPESVHLKYAELRLDALTPKVTVKPEDLQAYYDKVKSRYSEGEKRHAHHILIAADPKDAKSDAAALAKANEVEAELKSGKDFGELAKKYSADPGSAAQGGDLGWADKSAYVAPFADALFGMQAGQVSDPVKTQYGYHIIRLDEIRPAHVRAFDDVKGELETEYRKQQASELFGDRQEQIEQKLESGATDLDALAQQFELQSGDIAQYSRTSGAPPLGGNPALLTAVFSDDALSGEKIGGPVALSDDHLVIFKVLERHAPAPQPLASVRDEVVAAIRKSESTVAAKAAADAADKQLFDGKSFDDVVKSLGVTATPATYVGRNDPQVPAQIRDAAFNAPPPAGKPVARTVELDTGGAAVLLVSALKAGAAGSNPQNDAQLLSQYQRRDREGSMNAYLAELQRRATIKRNPTIFE